MRGTESAAARLTRFDEYYNTNHYIIVVRLISIRVRVNPD